MKDLFCFFLYFFIFFACEQIIKNNLNGLFVKSKELENGQISDKNVIDKVETGKSEEEEKVNGSEEKKKKKKKKKKKNNNNNNNESYEDIDIGSLSILPEPDELYNFLINEEMNENEKNNFINNPSIVKDSKKTIIKQKISKSYFLELYKQALSYFDIDGYNFLINKVMHKDYNNRFVQKTKRLNMSYVHCDKRVSNKDTAGNILKRRRKKQKNPKNKDNNSGNNSGDNTQYPGGAIRANYGENLSQWMKSSLENIETPKSIKEPGLANMLIQSLSMVRGLIQSVASTVVDIVPPLIPPPFWINRPLPCLPMVTGKNCLGSILYPITASEFVTANITDSIMNGIIASFPSKYAAKIGKTSDERYKLCAMTYLGMYCASLFPICWLPIGLRVAETMSVCFPQCLATLIACPGFWLDDIEGPCSNASVPPFCSFSIFINQKIVPPQLTSYDTSHSYPVTCPSEDKDYDISDNLYEHDQENKQSIFTKEKKKYNNLKLPVYSPLVTDIYDTHVGIKKIETCHCMNIIDLCTKHFAIPVVNDSSNTFIDSRHEEPVPIRLSIKNKRCCQTCKPIWLLLRPSKKKTLSEYKLA
ncbi:conserved protein, unknown function [Hepatocystis sp. ex Piliocolobus tephrosceles]|nr:conserved protein, unknown function [Hepatocystis sp. ex Piliocolobus tephrosceles]